MVRLNGTYRSTNPTMNTRFDLAAPARTRLQSSIVVASGFSQITCLPAAIASRAISACVASGVVITTTSTSRSPISSAAAPYVRSTPSCPAA